MRDEDVACHFADVLQEVQVETLVLQPRQLQVPVDVSAVGVAVAKVLVVMLAIRRNGHSAIRANAYWGSSWRRRREDEKDWRLDWGREAKSTVVMGSKEDGMLGVEITRNTDGRLLSSRVAACLRRRTHWQSGCLTQESQRECVGGVCVVSETHSLAPSLTPTLPFAAVNHVPR